MSAAVSIAMLMGNMGKGGVESVVMNYIRRIAGNDVLIDVILHERSPFPQRRELEELGVQWHVIPAYYRPLAYHRALAALFARRRYTIAHAHISAMSFFPLLAAWRAGIPVRICHNHSTAHWGETLRTLLKHLLRLPARLFATEYFASGEHAGRWMYGDRLFDAGRVFVLPNAIDGAAYAFNAEGRKRLRSSLGLDEESFVAGHVGRFVYQKNHAFLLEVFAQVKRLRPDAALWLIGEGPLTGRLEEKARSLGVFENVRFLGIKDDMGAWYSAMDVLILPSFYEGMPLVAAEAQANGLPVLLSGNITREALMAENSAMLSLRESPERWAAAALAASRRAACFPVAFEITAQAESLRAAYRHFFRRALGPGWDTLVIPPKARGEAV